MPTTTCIRKLFQKPFALAFLCGGFALPIGAATPLFGLSGPGGGSCCKLVFQGTGFSSFNLTTNTESALSADTSSYVATAFALDPITSMLYMEKQESDGFHLVSVSPAGAVVDISLLPTAFIFFVYNPTTNTLLGLAGSGAGGLSSNGLISSGTGFFSFNLTTKVETLLAADTNMYANTVFAFDQSSQNLYVERATNPLLPTASFELVAVNATGVESNVAPLPTVFKFFVFNATTHSLFGLGGPGGGGLGQAGLVSSGTGFFSFDLTALVESQLAADTNQYVNQAFAFDPGSQTLYVEEATNAAATSFNLAAVTATGGEFSVAPLPTVFKIFAFEQGSCPVAVAPFIGSFGPQYMQATFMSPTGDILTNYATACGFVSFNWQQIITVDPGDPKLFPTDPSEVPNNVYPAFCSTTPTANWPQNSCLLVAGPSSLTGLPSSYPSYFDPPPGGYTYLKSFNPFPFLEPVYPSLVPGETHTYFDRGFWCLIDTSCPPFPTLVSADGKTLSFIDDPTNTSLKGVAPSTTPAPGTFIAFSTFLVGVDNNNNAHPLYSWTWNSTFNGYVCPGLLTLLGCTTSGVSQTASTYPVIPGSGTGGVTITSIDGVQLPSVVLPSQVSTIASGLAYSRVSQTFNGMVTLKNISGSAISGPLQILFMGMPASVALVNATANLSGTPYLTVPAVTSLAPGQSVTVSVQFKNPSNATLNLSPVIYSGSIN